MPARAGGKEKNNLAGIRTVAREAPSTGEMG